MIRINHVFKEWIILFDYGVMHSRFMLFRWQLIIFGGGGEEGVETISFCREKTLCINHHIARKIYSPSELKAHVSENTYAYFYCFMHFYCCLCDLDLTLLDRSDWNTYLFVKSCTEFVWNYQSKYIFLFRTGQASQFLNLRFQASNGSVT